jgi:CubicO group peptidase (beta-lactamase class C family)
MKSEEDNFSVEIGTVGKILAAISIAAGTGPAIDTIFQPLIGARDPGAAVMVRQNGQTVFTAGYGVSDLNTFNKIGQETNFRLASVTKQFTAMAIMLLVHDGRLHYEDTLGEVFPDFPAYGRSITIRELLTHTSGLPDYEDLMGPHWSAAHQITDDDVLTLLKQQSRGKFAPGSSWAYSNSGYVVLGLIVGKVSGEPFADFLHERIFEKLHMTSTVVYINGKNEVRNRAYGYSRNEAGEFVPSDQSATSATLGDGGIYSNLLDMAKWDEALREGSLLDAAEMSAAFTPVKLADGSNPSWPATPGGDNLDPGKPVAYGFGWFLDPYKSQPRTWHSGTTSGFRTVVERFHRDKVSIIILANRTDLDPASLALRVADLVFSAR